jgi:hypothetical protein
MMLGYPRPVVQPLQRQVDIFVGLQLHHCQPSPRVVVSTSIMARSEAENAGTWE